MVRWKVLGISKRVVLVEQKGQMPESSCFKRLVPRKVIEKSEHRHLSLLSFTEKEKKEMGW